MSQPPWTPAELMQHADGMRRLARRLLGDEQQAEDVVQEALVKALDAPPLDEPKRRAWLSRVTRNLALDRMRSEKRRRQREARYAEKPQDAVTPAGSVERAEAHRRAVDAILALAEPYRSTLVERYLHDVPTDVIAQRQGCAPATVRTQSRRGLEMLRERLASDYDGEWKRACGLLLLPTLGEPETVPPASEPQSDWLQQIPWLAAIVLLVGGGAYAAFGGEDEDAAQRRYERQRAMQEREMLRAIGYTNDSYRQLGYTDDDTLDSLQELGYIDDGGEK